MVLIATTVQIIHKGAHLCPVSETEEKGLWARKFQLYKQSKQGETKENISHKSCDKPWKEGAEVITKKSIYKHNKSAQTLNINNNEDTIITFKKTWATFLGGAGSKAWSLHTSGDTISAEGNRTSWPWPLHSLKESFCSVGVPQPRCHTHQQESMSNFCGGERV